MIEAKFFSLNLADTTRRENPQIKPVKEKLSEEGVIEYSEKLAELAVERAHLGHLLYQETGQTKAARKGEKRKPSFRERLISVAGKRTAKDSRIKERKLTLEEELAAITEGKISQIIRGKPEEPRQRINDRLKAVEAQIQNLVASPQVVERYRKDFAEEVQTLKDVREIEKLRRWIEVLEANNETLVLKRQTRGLSQPDEEFLSYNQKRIAAARERTEVLRTNTEVLAEERIRELLGYRKQLKEQKIAETPTVKKYLREIRAALRSNSPVFLWGHTGVGKTEFLILASKQVFHREPEVLYGSEEINQYDIFGSKGFDEKGTFLEPGPLPVAWENKTMFLADEVDLMPHSVVGELHYILTRQPGDKVKIPGSAKVFTMPKTENYGFAATGNLRSEKYRQRQELDPAFLRRFWNREIKYLPSHETYDILLAALIDRRGALRVKTRTDVEEGLVNLCKAAKFVQDVFTGEKTDFMGEGAEASRGIGASLEKATLSIGDLLNIVQQWKAENFIRPLEDYLLSEFIQSQTVRRDQFNLVKIFCLHGFFQEKKAEDFDIPGLTEQKLSAYKTETSETP